MKIKHPAVIAVAIQLFPIIAHAQTEASSGDSSRLSALFWSTLPILIVAAVIVVVFRFAVSGRRAGAYDEYRERHTQHMEHVEQSLERIVRALEKKG